MAQASENTTGSESYESWASRPLIVPMPEPTAGRILGLVAIVFLPLGIAIAVLALLPTPQGLSIGHTGGAIAGIAAWWVVGLTWLQRRQRSAVDRIVREFVGGSAEREIDRTEFGRLVSRLMSARGCTKTEPNKWTRRDFDRLREWLGQPIPLVWSIDGFERGWLQRLLDCTDATVNASVRIPRSALGTVRICVLGIPCVLAVAAGVIWAIQSNLNKYVMFGGIVAVVVGLEYGIRFILGRSQWWLRRTPEGLVISRTNRAGDLISTMPLDPDSLVIISGVYVRVDRYAHYRIEQQKDLVAIRVLGPEGSPSFWLHAARIGGYQSRDDDPEDPPGPADDPV